MQEKRCEVCGESVPRDAMRTKGRLRCCLRCAQPPVVGEGGESSDSPEVPQLERIIRRFGVAVSGGKSIYSADAGTLRMRVATLTSH